LAQLKRALDAAYVHATSEMAGHVARDPVRFPKGYVSPTSNADAEIAAVFAAQLAFGRVELFGAVLERLFAEMDRDGGPSAWVAACANGRIAGGDPLVYRWFGRADFIALGAALGRLQAAEGLAAAFVDMESGITRLYGLADTKTAGAFFPTWFARPSQGSACKRWCMFLRWMVRDEAPDLGIWTHIAPARLVMPVDTHVLRIAQLTGLTERKAANWKTATELTDRLRAYAPADPVRYDFALAHLGISAGCTGAASPACDGCAMRSVCRVHEGAPARMSSPGCSQTPPR
jgi:uncharacterized protein (TIGR02757 family)